MLVKLQKHSNIMRRYWAAWYSKRAHSRADGQIPRKFWTCPYFWADGVCLSIPSFGYLATSLAALFVFVDTTRRAQTIPEASQIFADVVRQLRSWNIAFDVLYLIDGFLYVWGWMADARELVDFENVMGGDSYGLKKAKCCVILKRDGEIK